MLKETERAKARFNEGNKRVPSLNTEPTLKDLGTRGQFIGRSKIEPPIDNTPTLLLALPKW